MPSLDERANTPGASNPQLFSHLAFFALLAVACLWILHLPLFPTQDGPVHVYYARVSQAVLRGEGSFGEHFRVAHPLPPYAFHAYLLMFLMRFLSPELSEELLACACVLSAGVGFWYFARQLGRSGSIVAVFALPFFLHRYLFLGFYGFSFGIGLAFAAMGLWLGGNRGTWKFRAAFVGLSIVCLFAHPVPYLMMIVFCWAEVIAGHFSAQWQPDISNTAAPMLNAPSRADLVTLLAASSLIAYVELYSHSGPLLDFPSRDDLLYNLYRYGRTANLLIVIPLIGRDYRLLCCAVLLLGAIGAFWSIWKLRRSGLVLRAHLALAWGTLLLLVLPIVPENMNGGALFADRVSVWIVLFVMAAAALVEMRPTIAAVVLSFSVVLFICELGILQSRIAPIARELQVEGYPANRLRDVQVVTLNARFQPADLTFDPYWLSSVRMVDRGHGLLLDPPWLGHQILMLDRKEPELVKDMAGRVRFLGRPPAAYAVIWNNCVVRQEEPAKAIDNVNLTKVQWRVEQYGCFSVAEQHAAG
jgi:hypothetical protein